jgi:hypothetical protein
MPDPQSQFFESPSIDVVALLLALRFTLADVAVSPTNTSRAVFKFHRSPELTAALAGWADGTLVVDDSEVARARKLVRAKALIAVEQGGGR